MVAKLEGLHAAWPVLDDAEQEQIRDQEVKKWLVDLQDAVYCLMICWMSSPLMPPLPLPLKGIQVMFLPTLTIVKEKDDLVLKEELAKGLEDMTWRIQSSLVKSSAIYGRDIDKEAIREMLLYGTCDANISMIPIVGIGGGGKTTLAQLVYNDAKVEDKFDIKAWVCVSDQFDIVKNLLAETCQKVPRATSGLEALVALLSTTNYDDSFLVLITASDESSNDPSLVVTQGQKKALLTHNSSS
ncbi:Disease resistance protein [Arachis hypogaea]|nr:Disease resistance protein [Arachis hypogaea]